MSENLFDSEPRTRRTLTREQYRKVYDWYEENLATVLSQTIPDVAKKATDWFKFLVTPAHIEAVRKDGGWARHRAKAVEVQASDTTAISAQIAEFGKRLAILEMAVANRR